MHYELHKVPPSIADKALINKSQYQKMYERSLKDPEGFWAEHAERLTWTKKWSRVKNASFSGDVVIKWFEGARLNVSYNCIDRHLPKRAQQVAFYWEPDSPGSSARTITYQELHDQVCKFSHALKNRGIKKGDRVTIYMPMIPEAVYAMLACARIGAVHSVVFGGFSPEALAGRINDCESNCVITADEGLRAGKEVPLKANVDKALEKCTTVNHVFVVKHTGEPTAWNSKTDVWYHEATADAPTSFTPEDMDAEDPLFILYTSGSTGKPKGVLHTSAGYLLYASLTHQLVFDYHEGEVYWCTADVGWVTGHSYIVYGPLCNGATSVIFEGVPNYPDFGRHWDIVDKYKVNIYYTAPTAIRALMREGDSPVQKHSRKSLRILGSVGEPINPEAWEWYFRVVGESRCPIVDTWWQTETGGIMITPLPGASDLKPGSAVQPFFGVELAIVNEKGQVLEGEAEGYLCITDSWPGQMRTVYKNHQRFKDTYFSQFPGKYFTGDGCRRDKDGYYWITGRVDDVLNVSGHRIGTAEIESALVAHPAVAEAAVVGYPHEIKGQSIYAYVFLNADRKASADLREELVKWVRKEIGPIALCEKLQFVEALPKTRSGKIMRRILRKIAENNFADLGDTSTLADPGVVDKLIENRI